MEILAHLEVGDGLGGTRGRKPSLGMAQLSGRLNVGKERWARQASLAELGLDHRGPFKVVVRLSGLGLPTLPGLSALTFGPSPAGLCSLSPVSPGAQRSAL